MEEFANKLLINPKWSVQLKTDALNTWKKFLKLHPQNTWIGVTTSGTSGEHLANIIVLSISSLQLSAEVVNNYLNATAADKWCKVLPSFHVGGLGILVRACQSQSKIFDLSQSSWNADFFYNSLVENEITLTALVPTQLHDLIQKGYYAPKSIRAVIIGGAQLSDDLFQDALKFRWPLITTYGLSECASQVAVSNIGEKILKPLKHVEIKTDSEEILFIKSRSLLSFQIVLNKNGYDIIDHYNSEWFKTSDSAQILPSGELRILGRSSDYLKIGGEGIWFSQLENKFLENHSVLLPAIDARLGNKIVVLTTQEPELINAQCESYNQKVPPYAKIREVHKVNKIYLNDLGKILRRETLAQAGLQPIAHDLRQ